MSSTSNTPDVPGATGTEREEVRSSLASPNKGPTANHPRSTGAVFGMGIADDWASIATSDPAFWLKD